MVCDEVCVEIQSKYLETFIVKWQNIFLSVESNKILHVFNIISLL